MERQNNRQTQNNSCEVEDVAGFNPGTSSGMETAIVSHGVYAEQLPVVGESVGRIRSMYADRFDIDPFSQAIINGHEVDDDTIIESGQLLVFMNRAGEKG